MKKLSEKTIEILAKTFLVTTGFFELSSVFTTFIFDFIFDINDKQIERSSNLMGYLMIAAAFFAMLFYLVGV